MWSCNAIFVPFSEKATCNYLLLNSTHGGLQLKGEGVVLMLFVLEVTFLFLHLLSQWPQLFYDWGQSAFTFPNFHGQLTHHARHIIQSLAFFCIEAAGCGIHSGQVTLGITKTCDTSFRFEMGQALL